MRAPVADRMALTRATCSPSAATSAVVSTIWLIVRPTASMPEASTVRPVAEKGEAGFGPISPPPAPPSAPPSSPPSNGPPKIDPIRVPPIAPIPAPIWGAGPVLPKVFCTKPPSNDPAPNPRPTPLASCPIVTPADPRELDIPMFPATAASLSSPLGAVAAATCAAEAASIPADAPHNGVDRMPLIPRPTPENKPPSPVNPSQLPNRENDPPRLVSPRASPARPRVKALEIPLTRPSAPPLPPSPLAPPPLRTDRPVDKVGRIVLPTTALISGLMPPSLAISATTEKIDAFATLARLANPCSPLNVASTSAWPIRSAALPAVSMMAVTDCCACWASRDAAPLRSYASASFWTAPSY